MKVKKDSFIGKDGIVYTHYHETDTGTSWYEWDYIGCDERKYQYTTTDPDPDNGLTEQEIDNLFKELVDSDGNPITSEPIALPADYPSHPSMGESEAACECGAEKAGLGIHSDWCPKCK